MIDQVTDGRPGDISQLRHGANAFWFERVDVKKATETLREFLDVASSVAASNARKDGKPVRVLIVAGEATDEEYRPTAESFKKLLGFANVNIEMAAGPILSGNEDGESIVLRLVSEYPNSFTFYRFRMREEDHWKMVLVDNEPVLLQLECPHVPAPQQDCYKTTLTREGYFFTSVPELVTPLDRKRPSFRSVFRQCPSPIASKDYYQPVETSEQDALRKGFDVVIRDNKGWFENYYKGRLDPFTPKQGKDFVLPSTTINSVYESMKKRGALYDFSTAEDILNSVETS